MITDKRNFLKWFRDAAPYIREHNGKTFVIQIDGELVASDRLQGFIHDVALLHTLGVKLVLVFGVRAQVERLISERGIESEFLHNLRVTDAAALDCFKEAVGAVRFEIEALLSMGLPNSPMAHSDITVSSGNFVTAQPMGVIDGIDMRFTGALRKVDTDKIRLRLDQNEIVLLSPLGTSVTGDVFNLSAPSVATCTAIGLQADKLILSFPFDGISNTGGEPIHQMTTDEAGELLDSIGDRFATPYLQLADAVTACRKSVHRVHLIDCRDDSSLMIELFSRDGAGTLVSDTRFDSVRAASQDDIAGILELITPLVNDGKLLARSREELEKHIGDFSVLDREGTVIACVAVHEYPQASIAEIACVAVHPDYRNQGKGELLFQRVEAQLKKNRISRAVLLTTQANHWFMQLGFTETSIETLPIERQQLYDYQRSSKVLIKEL
ncbi:MAG: amino-acid N-acetyltransferase [Thiotrichales bacterium]|nr:amino-acid N-acetyltransferase [Thiotrichales bacterium]